MLVFVVVVVGGEVAREGGKARSEVAAVLRDEEDDEGRHRGGREIGELRASILDERLEKFDEDGERDGRRADDGRRRGGRHELVGGDRENCVSDKVEENVGVGRKIGLHVFEDWC